ncbi:MAG: UbiA family prenyltransferase [Chitinophagales bacterium]
MKEKKELWLNAFRLLRIPFSVFLMPIFWFALLHTEAELTRAILVFVTLHLFVYPASNGYNSYFDRDEQSIGGLKTPPKVTRELWYLVVSFDVLALGIGLMINLLFGVMVFVYLMISKAYSYDKIRLKKYPVIGAITVVLFQGLFTYLAIQKGVHHSFSLTADNLAFGIVSSLFLLGSYPMTQIYQHQEDEQHGDHTLSRMLGINGTFIFTGIVFFVASAVICFLFYRNQEIQNIIIYLVALFPVNIYFLKWYNDFKKGKPVITFERTMLLNAMSSLLLSAAFITMLLLKEVP